MAKFHTTHGLSRSRTYKTWQGMKDRCCNPGNTNYPAYGAKGVKVCDRWLESFENFLSDMGERPPGKTLDRYPNQSGDYEPSNCRWATTAEQNRNKSDNNVIEFNGERLILADWARRKNMSWECLKYRIQKWGVERALSEPIQRTGRRCNYE